MNKAFDEIRRYAEQCLSRSRGSHDWDHTCRVVRLCMHIGRVEGADMGVLEVAALLHDIGRSRQDRSRGRICHADLGAKMAEPLLEPLPLSWHQKQNVLHAIRSHRFRGDGRPETLEAEVLFDADKLDAIGAIGIARAFQFAGEVGARLHNPDADPERSEPYSLEDTGYREFKIKLSKIRERMLTREGRRLAEDRHIFMEQFFQRFILEHEGTL